MIKKTEKAVIVSVLGNHYSTAVIEHLNKKEIFNADGNPFSAISIRQIVTGKRNNLLVEIAIIEMVIAKQKAIETAKVRRKNLLKR